jgi:hypothetical protein
MKIINYSILGLALFGTILISTIPQSFAATGDINACYSRCLPGNNSCMSCCDNRFKAKNKSCNDTARRECAVPRTACQRACRTKYNYFEKNCETSCRNAYDKCVPPKLRHCSQPFNISCPSGKDHKKCEYSCQTYNPAARKCVGSRSNIC